MYVLYNSKNILTLVTIGYIVGFIVGMYIENCLWAQVAVLDIYCIYWTVWDRYMQVLYLGRALRTKESMPDFLKWRRVAQHPLVFRRLTGSQRTPGFWGVKRPLHRNTQPLPLTTRKSCEAKPYCLLQSRINFFLFS